MATLTVWKFPVPEGADEAVGTLRSLQKQQLIKVHDAAVVNWPPDRKQPRTKQLHNIAGVGALSGSFWGCSSACCSSYRCWAWRSARPWAR